MQGSPFEDKSYIHLVMEVCEGGELFDRIAEKGHFSEKQAAEVMRTVVSVVHHCHTMNVIHRDLKPENFLVRRVLCWAGKDQPLSDRTHACSRSSLARNQTLC